MLNEIYCARLTVAVGGFVMILAVVATPAVAQPLFGSSGLLTSDGAVLSNAGRPLVAPSEETVGRLAASGTSDESVAARGFGACCLEDGSCVQTDGWECDNYLFGVYLGDGTVCEPNPCGQTPVGACCDRAAATCVDDVPADQCPISLEWTEGVLCADLDPPCEPAPVDRVDIKKGSLLVFPKVELRWSAAGELIQDTFLDLTNDYPDDVLVQMYFFNGDPPLDAEYDEFGGLIERAHLGHNWVDNEILLTANEPTYWSAATGLPKGTSPFSMLDPGDPVGRSDPDGSDERVMRGYVIAYAVNADGEEIRWNHLKGDVIIINYPDGAAWEYNAYAFAASTFFDHGAVLDLEPGVLHMDGLEYDLCFDRLLLDFYAVGSSALSAAAGASEVVVDTDLTLFPVDADFRQESDGPVCFKAHFDIWNMNEVKFSGTHRCICAWDQELLSMYEAPNHFLLENLHTDKGKARIDGVRSEVCGWDESQDAAILGVVAKLLTYSGSDLSMAGMHLVGMGYESAVIRVDILAPPPELLTTP